jgi:general secretion pathway protein F
MALYYYKALNAKGKKKQSRIEANSLLEAKEKLRVQGILMTEISSQNPTSFLIRKKKDELTKDKLLALTTQLAQLISAGLPLYESLVSLAEQYSEEKFHSILTGLCEKIKGGSSLSQAMSHYKESFDVLFISMVAAGESVGALKASLERLSELLEKQLRLRKQIVTALIYPAVLSSFSVLVVILLLTFAIPSIELIFEGRTLNPFTHLVIATSHFLTRYWMVYLPLISATLFLVYSKLKKPSGKLFLHHLYLKLPIFKKLTIQTALARFSRTMGTLQQGGVSILEALKISRRVMKNPLLEEVVERAESKVIEGVPLSVEFKRSPLIPVLVSRMIAIGEESGNTGVMFHKIADLYESEVEKTLNRLTAMAQPLILLFMGGVVGIIMTAILLPLTDINAFISN